MECDAWHHSLLNKRYPVWSQYVLTHDFELRSHNLTVLSSEPETISRESGENFAVRTQFKWPASVYWNLVRCVDQSFVRYKYFDCFVVRRGKECFRVGWELHSADRRSMRLEDSNVSFATWDTPYTLGVHSRTVLSLDDDASTFPAAAKSSAVTAPLWPTKRNARSCGLKFQIMTEWSMLALAALDAHTQLRHGWLECKIRYHVLVPAERAFERGILWFELVRCGVPY